MSWTGKFLGGTFGFLMGGPLGAILGASLGHQFDSGFARMGNNQERFNLGDQQRVQTAFFTATFSVMGHIAKADGQASKSEIELAKRVMDEMMLSKEMRQSAINLFHQGKAVDFPLDEVLYQFRKECHRRHHLVQMFIEIQIQVALADNVLDRREDAILLYICSQIGVSRFDFQRIKIKLQAQNKFQQQGQYTADYGRLELKNAYAILGINADVSDADVKKSYRRLMNQNHPDKLVAKGLPESMMIIAKQKTQKIRKAYDLVQNCRKNIK